MPSLPSFHPECLAGRVALITGGGTGIGKGIAKVFLSHGAKVAIASRNVKTLQETAQALERSTGGTCLPVVCNVRSPSSVASAVATVLSVLGSIDILVNNAAGNFLVPLEALTLKGFQAVMDTDAIGVFTVSKAVFHAAFQGAIKKEVQEAPIARQTSRNALSEGGEGAPPGASSASGVRTSPSEGSPWAEGLAASKDRAIGEGGPSSGFQKEKSSDSGVGWTRASVYTQGGCKCIINISMTLHYTGALMQTHAGAAKAAIDALTKHMAVEWGPYKVRVNAVAPGPIKDTRGLERINPFSAVSAGVRSTNVQSLGKKENQRPDAQDQLELLRRFVPLQRLGTVEDVAYACLFLALPEASYITGSTLVVDGGQWLTSGNYTALQPEVNEAWRNAPFASSL
ncbi:hypothetical protein cyc_00045 [Cyclospora cayetanensis]|nr:hypothetical protein cyc_00045 [Cyclospora cayetanensis]